MGSQAVRAWSPLPPTSSVSEGACVCAKLIQPYLILCDRIDYSPRGSSVHGILQARILECVAMPSSRGSSRPRDQTGISYTYLEWQVGCLPLALPGKPRVRYTCWVFPFLSISLYANTITILLNYFSTTAHRLWAPWQHELCQSSLPISL